MKSTRCTAGLLVALALASCEKSRSQTDTVTTSDAKDRTTWLRTYDFDAAAFQKPALEFGPFTRWWWPGNDVTRPELQREVKLLADNGFGGVEIQPFTRGLNLKADSAEQNRVNSWDTPAYYANLKAVLDQAQQSGLTVDLNGGSGWPTGGPHIKPEDNILNLRASAVTVKGGALVQIAVPAVNMAHRQVAMGGIAVQYAPISPALAKLQAVVAAKIVQETAGEPVRLDPKTTVDISRNVSNGQLRWQAPPGQWKVMAFWAFPAGEQPVLIAKKDRGLVVDPFDSTKLTANYDYLFGQRTGLAPYYGKPLRALFNDSYEYQVDRHYMRDFRAFFKQQRGYDITSWLPANMVAGYNNHSESTMLPNQKPDYTFSGEDWRLQYDYDLTVSDALQAQFFNSSRKWLESRGMLHRTQAYGLHMDVIAASGNASIPETEQLFSEGSEGFLKVVTSGAHLYNRPITTAETAVYRYRAEMTTPQKLKISVDKAFAAGVNQVIYHGTSYRYRTPDFGPQGWNAWDSPFTPNVTYSSNINEQDSFWPAMKGLNQYIGRTQYALRAGKPHTDVLVYFPFLGLESREHMSNPEELLINGYFKGVEPENVATKAEAPGRLPAEATRWFQQVWPTLNQLEAAGVTWEFVNDLSIQAARLQGGQLTIRGNTYQGLILPYEPYIQLASAQKINELSKAGAKLLVVGDVPAKQPSFRDYAANDRKTQQLLTEAVQQANSQQLPSGAGLSAWMGQLAQPVKFNGTYRFTRQLEREMADGSRLHFIWNKSDKWQTIALTLEGKYRNAYWLDAEMGLVSKARPAALSYTLPPYGAVILYAATNELPGNVLATPAPTAYGATDVATIAKWDIKAGAASLTNVPLFDWRTKEPFKYLADEGRYSATITVSKAAGRRYFLDLGTVYFTAEVLVNGQPAGKRVYAPYQLDVTSLLKSGPNQVEVRVLPAPRNHAIGEARQGALHYAQYQALEHTLLPAGLLGPVVLKASPAVR